MHLDTKDSDALLVIDVQNDFCANGSLAVPDGDAVVPYINTVGKQFAHIVVTQDWHPAGHLSFASSHSGAEPFSTTTMPYGEQTLWPEHCIQGSHGAAFHPALALERAELIIRKGYRPAIDSYSAFFENDQKTPTGLGGYLNERGITRVFCVGLATDFCVRFSVEDARKQSLDTVVLLDGCRGINMEDSVAGALQAMQSAGATLIG